MAENPDNIKVINLGTRTVTLKIEEFNNEVDVDDALKIDYGNILGEILTFPVYMNRLGNLLEDCDDFLRREEYKLTLAKDDLDRQRAIAEQKAFRDLKKGAIDEPAINSPTKDQIQGKVRLDQEHQKFEQEYNAKKLAILDIERDKGYLKNLYWSGKFKADMLTKISDKVKPADFEGEIMDGVINGIMVKNQKNLIQ